MHATSASLWTRPFLLICFAHLAMTVGFYATMPVYSIFLNDRFHLEGMMLGAAVASYTASAILFRPPAGYYLDKLGRRAIYLPSYALFGLIYFLYPLADSVFSVSLARILHGALWGVAMGAATTAAVDVLPPKRRGEGIGYFGMAMILGMSGGPALGTFIAETHGYNSLFVCVGLLTAVGFVILCLTPFPTIPRTARPFTLHSLMEPSSLPASAATLISCIPYGCIMNFTSMYARTLSGASAGAFFLCLALGTALSRLRSGTTFDQKGPGGVMTFGYAFMLAGYLLLTLTSNSVLFVFSGLLIGLGYGVTIPVIQAMINALVPPERRGAANATLMTAFDLGICIGLLILSQMIDRAGWQATFIVMTGCIVASALVFRLYSLPRYKAGLDQQAKKQPCRDSN